MLRQLGTLLFFIMCFLSTKNSLAQKTEQNWSVGAGLFYYSEREYLTPQYWYWNRQLAANLYFGCDLFKNYYRTGAEVRFLYFNSD